MDFLSGEDMRANGGHDRVQQPGGLSDPVAQCRAIEFQTLPGVDVALPIERQVIAVFRDQQMRQHGGRGPAARRRHGRSGRLGNCIARTAGKFRPNVPDHLEVPGHIIEHLGHVLPELLHAAATGGTDARIVTGGLMHDLLPGQVIGERFAFRFCPHRARDCGFAGFGAGDILGLAGLQLLQLQFQLLDLARDPLRGAAKLHPTQLGDLKAELLDLQRPHLHGHLRGPQFALASQGEGAQGVGIGRQFGRGERHAG